MINALKLVKKKLSDVQYRLHRRRRLRHRHRQAPDAEGRGQHIVGCDRAGAIYQGRTENMNSMKQWFAEHTNPARDQGHRAATRWQGADVFIGLSGPGVVSLKDIKAMNRDAIVFAMANPIPEILPEEVGTLRARDGHRPLRLSEPDQQLVRLPRLLPRPARRAGPAGERRDEAGRRPRASPASSAQNELSEEYITPSMFDPRAGARGVPPRWPMPRSAPAWRARTGAGRPDRGDRRDNGPAQECRQRSDRGAAAREAQVSRRPRLSPSGPSSAGPRSTRRPLATRFASGSARARELTWFKPWKKALDWKPPYAKWFVGGKLNVSLQLSRPPRRRRRAAPRPR